MWKSTVKWKVQNIFYWLVFLNKSCISSSWWTLYFDDVKIFSDTFYIFWLDNLNDELFGIVPPQAELFWRCPDILCYFYNIWLFSLWEDLYFMEIFFHLMIFFHCTWWAIRHSTAPGGIILTISRYSLIQMIIKILLLLFSPKI